MEKNKSFSPAVRAGGARYYHAAGENGYGLNSDAPFSKGPGTYDPHPQDAAPINLSGKENFAGESRFMGGNGQSREGVSGTGEKDSIVTGGGGNDSQDKGAF